MKREDPERQTEVAIAEPEVATTEAAQAEQGASETYLAEGAVPAVAEAPVEAVAAAPTASEQAFSPEETPEQADQKAIKAATEYNDDRPHNVAEFNQLTESSCMKHGALDIEKVRDFQKAAHLDADGRIGPWTLAAAKRSSEVREQIKASEAEQEAKLKPKKIEQLPAQEAVLAPIIAAPVAAKVDAPKETVAGAPELAQSTQKNQAAIEFNERHAALVAEFNQVTDFACTEGGNLDIEKVMEFQLAHGCKADGRIDVQTLSAAKQTSQPLTHAELEAAPPVEEVVQERA
ncbi:hypothetical protein BH11MYX1_BH11MYX1_14820 [soil metagenome]